MLQNESSRQKSPNEFPLTFVNHNFGAYCYNAIGCQVFYDNFDFSLCPEGSDPKTYVSSAPQSRDYKSRFDGSYIVMAKDFPTPVHVRWRSLDGASHEAEIDLGKIFPGRRVLHRVPESDYAERSFGGSVDIIVEVNDRTINVYMKAFVATSTEQIPGNKNSYGRIDLILASSRDY
jgi:hypothetical protein